MPPLEATASQLARDTLSPPHPESATFLAAPDYLVESYPRAFTFEDVRTRLRGKCAILTGLERPSSSGASMDRDLHRGREIVRQFTPNWFTATMGTGILALALNQFPRHIPGLHSVAQGLWLLNIFLFLVFSALYLARWIVHNKEARRIFGHSVVSMFFGAIPMGLATIINGFLVFGLPLWGNLALQTARGLWWLDALMSVACGVLIPFMMFTRQEHSLEKMTAVWLLPVVAAEVAAASGAVLVPHMLDSQAALRIIVISYVLWAFSVPLAMSILVILLTRLVLHKLPSSDMAATGWLALGPIGTGALGLMLLGNDASQVFPTAGLPGIGEVAFGIGAIGGSMLWGYGLWWLFIALLTTARYLQHDLPFNLGWWGFTFPIGVYAVATLTLARLTHIGFLTVIGGALVIGLSALWLTISTRTLHGAWYGYLFVAPCLVPGSIPADRQMEPEY
jgi:C4-dicarboxylate transporter/malic acid transport protein